MSLVALSDAQIDEFLACPERVENPGSKPRVDGKHVRRDFRVSSDDGRHEFILFTRQSVLISESYSAGLRWKAKTGEEVILLRCNGSDHAHRNAVERQEFTAQSHVHRATEKYILAGRKAESFARTTQAYRTLAGALNELVRIANIAGLETRPDEPDLFA